MGYKVSEKMDQFAHDNIAQITEQTYDMCSSAENMVRRITRQTVQTAKGVLNEEGRITLSKTEVEWRVRDISWDGTEAVLLPVLSIGDNEVVSDPALDEVHPLVDEVHHNTGAQCSIYQRMNEAGDMLRVSSTIAGEGGERALGKVIQSRPSGRVDPRVAAVLRGREYMDRQIEGSRILHRGYIPLVASGDRVAGMIEVLVHPEGLEAVRESILRTQVGSTGYVWVLRGKGPQRGEYIVSQGGRRDGENIWYAKDAVGEYFVQDLVHQALSTPPGEISFVRYQWRNPGEEVRKPKIAAITYFAPWDWVIGAGAYESEFHAAKQEVQDSFRRLMIWITLAGAGLLALVLLASFYMGGRIAGPISRMVEIARKVADGDIQSAHLSIEELAKRYQGVLDRAEEDQGRGLDETGRLFLAVRDMTESLDSLVGQMQRSGIQVTASATQISAQVRQLESTVNRQATATAQVGATTKEISATSKELTSTVSEVRTAAAETADLADLGQEDLEGMSRTVSEIIQATDSIQSTLREMIEKTENITGVVETIAKVADQTNLLSLNAAIEAEKAGEYGLGFSVVAEEIRRLADQTAVAALEIERTIGEMSEAVTRGVKEMEAFAVDVKEGAGDTERVKSRLERILTHVQGISFRFDSVSEGMRTQSESASQISDAMSQLADSASQTSDAVQEFNRTAVHLNQAVKGLQSEVSRFTVSD